MLLLNYNLFINYCIYYLHLCKLYENSFNLFYQYVLCLQGFTIKGYPQCLLTNQFFGSKQVSTSFLRILVVDVNKQNILSELAIHVLFRVLGRIRKYYIKSLYLLQSNMNTLFIFKSYVYRGLYLKKVSNLISQYNELPKYFVLLFHRTF